MRGKRFLQCVQVALWTRSNRNPEQLIAVCNKVSGLSIPPQWNADRLANSCITFGKLLNNSYDMLDERLIRIQHTPPITAPILR